MGLPKSREKQLRELDAAFTKRERAAIRKKTRRRYKTPAKVREKRRAAARDYRERRKGMRKAVESLIDRGELVRDYAVELESDFDMSPEILWKEFRAAYSKRKK